MRNPREKETELLSLLGLAARAGAVAKGTEATRKTLRAGRAKLVIFAGDAAQAQRCKVEGLAQHSSVPSATLAERASLGAAVGGPPLSAVAVTSGSFAGQMLGRLKDGAET